MRFRKRLSAAILAIVMMISSIQIPGGTSYAAEMEGSSIESEQEVLIPAEDEVEGSSIESEQEALIPAEDEVEGSGIESEQDVLMPVAEDALNDQIGQVEDSSETANYEGDVLVEKEVKASGQNFDNLDYTFKTTDDQTVSSKADGRPKVLVFFRAKIFCVDSITTLGRIGNVIDDFDGVDIYAIETEGATKDEVITFKNKYKGAGMTYCYDLHDPEWPDSETESGWAMWQYYRKFVPSANEVSLPVIVYIDAENRLQHYTTGPKNPEDVLADLKNYCNYIKPEIYNITYVMNGGVNRESNPDSYSYSPDSGDDIVLARPYYREGYKFEGWYSDAKYTELVTKIPAGSRSDITLYAKWSERKGGFGLENLEQNYLPLNSEAEMTSAADGKPKLLVFYGNDVNGTPKVLSEITEALSSEPEHDLNGVDIYAIATDNPWGGSNKEAIEADQRAVSDKIAFSYDESGSNWGKMKGYAEAVDYWGYGNNMELRPVICYIDAQNNFQYLSIQEQTVEQVMSNLSAYCNYPAQEDVETYNITYVLDDGENDEGNPDTYTEKTETIVLKAAVKEGYTFDGWYKDAEFEEEVTEIASGSTGDITLYAKWIKADAGANLENLDYTFTTIDDKTVSSKADGKPKVLLFFSAECWNCQQTNKSLSEHISEFTDIDIYSIGVNSETKEEISAFKNAYGCDGITYSYDTGWSNNLAMWDYCNKFDNGDTYDVMPIIFFIDAENRLQHVTTGLRSWSDILGDLQEYCKYTPSEIVETYNIIYMLDGGENDSGNPDTYTAQTETITLKAASKKGYTFGGWYKDAEFEEEVKEIVKGSTGDITLYAKWIKADEGQGKENPEYTFTTIDDQTVSSKADGKPKVLFFLKTDCTNCQQTNISLSEHINEFTGVDIYAIGSNRETKDEISNFKSEYGCDGITYCYDTGWTSNQAMWDYYSQFYTGGTTYILTPVIIYIDAENRLQHITTGFRSWSNILENLKEYCNYTPPERVETYNIIYVLDGGTNDSGNPDTYTEQTETITLKAADKEGYIFDGWYKDAEFKEEVKSIAKGSTGDITLYANWIKIEEGQNIENPEYRFETIDNQIVSSKADGKPKVLFFFRTNCYYCQQTNKSLSEHINEFTGVDIYAIGINRETKEEISDFKSEYGCDGITYCYDTGSTNNSAMWDYCRKFGAGDTTVVTPVIIYIDAENRVQHMTTGLRSWSDILVDLKKYCKYTLQEMVETYNITYVLDGGTNDGSNPSTYTVETETITLKAAVKDDYIFDGWYTDAEFKKIVTKIVKGSTGDITLYAKWIPLTQEDDRIDLAIAGVTIADIKTKVYDASEYEPALKVTVKVTVNGKQKTQTLVEGADYSVTYEDNVEAGTGTAYVNGNGMYKGEVSKTFTISRKPVKKLKVITGNVAGNVSERSIGNKSAELPVYVYDGRKLLTEADYDLAIKQSNEKAVTVEITAKEGSNYTGSRTAKLTVYNSVNEENVINPENIFIDGKTFIEEYETEYTGKAIKPEVAVRIGSTTLTSKDYKVAYQNNKDAGTAYVIVTGKGVYKGKVVVPFSIVPVSPVLTITNTIKDKTYNGKLQKPAVKVKAGKATLKNNKDYKVVYTENLHAGTATITVTGRGNYTGSTKTTFVINKQNIKKVSVKGTQNEGLSVYYGTRLLVKNRDYTLEYGNSKGKNKIEVIITAAKDSDFSGSVTKSVKIQ